MVRTVLLLYVRTHSMATDGYSRPESLPPPVTAGADTTESGIIPMIKYSKNIRRQLE